MKNYVLKISCRDQKGLVHSVSGILAARGYNLTENAEFVDHESERFFMRSEATAPTESDAGLTEELQGVLPEEAKISWKPLRKRRIVVFATKEYNCLGDLLLRAKYGNLNAEIAAVICNREPLGDLVGRFDIPFHFVSAEGKTRAAHEREVSEIADSYAPDYIVLAKYMRILSADFMRRRENRIINIHHSFLPAFIGANPYRQAYERGVKIIGATAHFVNSDLDEGPIIVQDITRTDHKRSPKALSAAGKYLEVSVLAKALELVFADRVFVYGNKTVIFD